MVAINSSGLDPALQALLFKEAMWFEVHGFRTIGGSAAGRFQRLVLGEEHHDHPNFNHFRPKLRKLFRQLVFQGFREQAAQKDDVYDLIALEITWGQPPLDFSFQKLEQAWRAQAFTVRNTITSFGLEILLSEWLYTSLTFPEAAVKEPQILTEPFAFLVPPEDRPWLEGLLGHFGLAVKNDYAWRRAGEVYDF